MQEIIMRLLLRLCCTGILLVGAVAANAFGAASQEAVDPAKKADQHSPWASRCTSNARGQPAECALEQRAIARETGRVIGIVTIRLPSETRKPVTMIQLPVGLFLPAGVDIDVDGDMAQNFPFQTCNANACFVGFPLSDQLLKRMHNGGKFNVTFQYLNKKPVTLPMSLEGFTDAYARIK
jgi:invasion protein IalB